MLFHITYKVTKVDFALKLHSSDNDLLSVLKFPITGVIRYCAVEAYPQKLEECCFTEARYQLVLHGTSDLRNFTVT